MDQKLSTSRLFESRIGQAKLAMLTQGQQDQLAALCFRHRMRKVCLEAGKPVSAPQHLLIASPSGGVDQIVQNISELAESQVYSFPADQLVGAGWVGAHIEDLAKGLRSVAGDNAETAILHLTNLDKIAARRFSNDVGGLTVQHSLLPFLLGATELSGKAFSFANLMILGSGRFTELPGHCAVSAKADCLADPGEILDAGVDQVQIAALVAARFTEEFASCFATRWLVRRPDAAATRSAFLAENGVLRDLKRELALLGANLEITDSGLVALQELAMSLDSLKEVEHTLWARLAPILKALSDGARFSTVVLDSDAVKGLRTPWCAPQSDQVSIPLELLIQPSASKVKETATEGEKQRPKPSNDHNLVADSLVKLKWSDRDKTDIQVWTEILSGMKSNYAVAKAVFDRILVLGLTASEFAKIGLKIESRDPEAILRHIVKNVEVAAVTPDSKPCLRCTGCLARCRRGQKTCSFCGQKL